MPRFVFSQIVDDAARVLFAKHRPATSDQYGKCEVAGYTVSEGTDGKIRVSHRTPEPDLLDDDRPSDDNLAAARHRMVDAYAATLAAAGWTVHRRAPRSRKPFLLASP